MGLLWIKAGIPERHKHAPTMEHKGPFSTTIGREERGIHGDDLTDVSKGDRLASDGVRQHNWDVDVRTNIEPASLLVEGAGQGLGTSE